jgi:hypothetical protein
MGLEVEESEEKGKNVGMSQEEIDDLVQKKLDKALGDLALNSKRKDSPNEGMDPEAFATMISRGISDGMKTKAGQFVFGEGFTEDEIDVDDILLEDDWVVFAVHKIYDIIVGDKRHGKQIRAPFEPIEFIIQGSKIVKNGKESSITNFATYTCKSRKELDWLKNHTQYNIRFFDSVKGAISSDSKKATLLSKNMNLLSSMNQHQIYRYAQDHNVDITSDLAIMKAELATILTEKEMGKFKSWQKDTFKQQMEEAESVGEVIHKQG